ncbi:estrogen-related receptor gamma-like [Asterias rubens]|uniref:estrogen-related receptor gamma-like n=1 Tax=Asterias rubens TaxID=7604 RepID=UPI0014558B98|nr:estrogen-related receptor gamma-like [Asterias rubens]
MQTASITTGFVEAEGGSTGMYGPMRKERSRRLCVVCKGLATGYHYGVASCEACKAFFKRTVQRKLAYSCSEDQQCEVLHGNRRTCQSCRYNKCIKEGMMVEGVRLNRCKGGRQEYRRRPDERDFSPVKSGPRKKNQHPCDFSTRLLDIEPEVLKITMPEELVEWYRLHGADSTEVTPKAGMIIMAELADRALINTVQWAKKVPGFEKLCLSDQMALLCNSWMEILLTNVIYRSSLLQQSKEKPLFFADGFIMTRRLCIEKGVLIYDQITNVVDRLRPLGVSKGIAVLLKAMILFNAGPSLSNPLPLQATDELQELQLTAFDALHQRIYREHPKDYRLVYRLMTLLPLIKDIALTISSLVWIEFNQEQVPMQRLLSEVLQPFLHTRMGQKGAPIHPPPQSS